MIGYHVTNLENLDSILEFGLLAKDTTKNNWCMASENRGIDRVFFMTTLEAAREWAKTSHKWSDGIRPKKDEEMVIIEIRATQSYSDPYKYDELQFSRFSPRDILPAFILDIHEVA